MRQRHGVEKNRRGWEWLGWVWGGGMGRMVKGRAVCVIIRAETMDCTQNSLSYQGKGTSIMSTGFPDCLIPCMDKKITSHPHTHTLYSVMCQKSSFFFHIKCYVGQHDKMQSFLV